MGLVMQTRESSPAVAVGSGTKIDYPNTAEGAAAWGAAQRALGRDVPTTEEMVRTASDRQAVLEGCYYDHRCAQPILRMGTRIIRRIDEGHWGEPFFLMEWEARQIIMPLFGWRRADGRRRITDVYLEVPKKNGKSGLISFLVLIVLTLFRLGRNIYSAANARDQAALIYEDIVKLIKATAAGVVSLVDKFSNTDSSKLIVNTETGDAYKSLSADADVNEGLRGAWVIIDEVHVLANRKLWRALRYALRGAKEPVFFKITTAGEFNAEAVGWTEHERARKIIEGSIIDTTALAVIFGIGDKDDWEDERNWVAANPSMGECREFEIARAAWRRETKALLLEDFQKAIAMTPVKAESIDESITMTSTSTKGFLEEAELEFRYQWVLAHPSAGELLSLEQMREDYARAKGNAAAESEFQRYLLNRWMKPVTAVQWTGLWAQWGPEGRATHCCGYRKKTDPAALIGVDGVKLEEQPMIDLQDPLFKRIAIPVKFGPDGRPEGLTGLCIGAIDLAYVFDFAAYGTLWQGDPEHGVPHWWECLFWMNSDRYQQYVDEGVVPIAEWVKRGYLTLTPGDVTDYTIIQEAIVDRAAKDKPEEICFDRYTCNQMSQDLQEKKRLLMVEVPQTERQIGPGITDLERLVKTGGIAHDGNPVMTWMMSNCYLQQRGEGSKFVKESKKSPNCVDGPVALSMATVRMLGRPVAQVVRYSGFGF